MAFKASSLSWSQAAACCCLMAAGCAQPFGKTAGMRANPLSEAAKTAKARRSLKDPVGLDLKYARWQEQIGNLVEARKSYDSVLNSSPKSVDAILGVARLDHLAGRNHEAEQGFRRALKIKPNDPHSLDSIGQFYAAEKRWDEAVKMLNAAVMQAPADPAYRYHLGVTLARSGDIDAAFPHFEKTLGDAQAHYNIGFILYEQGKLEDAEKQLHMAAIKKPDLQEAQVLLDRIAGDRDEQTMLANMGTDRSAASDFAAQGVRRSGPFAPRTDTQRVVPTGYRSQAQPDSARPSAASNPFANLSPKPAAKPKQSAPDGMSPSQYEQWQNQLRSATTD